MTVEYTLLALAVPGCETKVFEGRVNGRIAEKKQGTNGFGYDPVFIPDGYDVTFGDLDKDAKNAISHRGRAFAKFIGALK